MNNEPVAYAMFKNGEYYDAIHPDEQAKTVGEYDIPLYTHPVKEEHFEDEPQAEELHEILQSNAELTDEEIVDIWGCAEYMIDHNPDNAIKFARALLRKAQEK